MSSLKSHQELSSIVTEEQKLNKASPIQNVAPTSVTHSDNHHDNHDVPLRWFGQTGKLVTVAETQQ